MLGVGDATRFYNSHAHGGGTALAGIWGMEAFGGSGLLSHSCHGPLGAEVPKGGRGLGFAYFTALLSLGCMGCWHGIVAPMRQHVHSGLEWGNACP